MLMRVLYNMFAINQNMTSRIHKNDKNDFESQNKAKDDIICKYMY